jgi:hypothetical protein
VGARPVEGDGDRVGGVGDVAAEVEQVAQDRPVLVGVGGVGGMFPFFWTPELGCQMVDVPES